MKTNITKDEFGRWNGILLIDKPVGYTSHDIVNITRKSLKTKKVGHAGALDPFASGLLIILVGKATKLSDKFLTLNKEYLAKIMFGISTDSGDTEDKITKTEVVPELEKMEIEKSIEKLAPEYMQYAPVYSSVKVNGDKLRVLARKADKFEIFEENNERYVGFYLDAKEKIVKLPRHNSKIIQYELGEVEDVKVNQYFGNLEIETLPVVNLSIEVSKGTYIRQLAEDIGNNMKKSIPAVLVELKRTKVGELSIEDAISLDELKNFE